MNIMKIRLSSVYDVKSFVAKVMSYDYDFDLRSDKHIVDAKSILGIFSLDLSQELTLIANTDDTEALKDIRKNLAEFII